ncbi:MAG TPA: hypothetical protein VGS41_13140 [Chthonomonadales bacterium]|nr:hypothetical protein [Chthonomonadales bacterium]
MPFLVVKNHYRVLSSLLLLLCLLPTVARATRTSAANNPYRVTLAASNFGQNLFASALDLSNPGRALFSLQNGTPLWFGVGAQSTPSGIAPFAADASDLVTNTFFGGTVALLPADDALPPGYGYGQQHTPALKLAVAFVGPGEQAQITLNPYDSHATLLDVISLLLHLLGEQGSGIQVGLLAPNALATIFNDVSSMRYLQSLGNDYGALLQAVLKQGDASSLWQAAYTCSRDLVGLIADTTERAQLSNALWLVLGKTIPQASLLATLSAFGATQFGLGILGFFKDEALSIGGTLFQQNNPTLTLQSIADVTKTPTPVKPKATPTRKP